MLLIISRGGLDRLPFVIATNLALLAIFGLYAITSFSQITEVWGCNGTSGGAFNVFLKERYADLLTGNRGVFVSYGDLVELGGTKKSGSCFFCGRAGVEYQNGNAGQSEGGAESPSGGSYSGSNGGAGGDGEDDDDKDARLLKEDKKSEMSFLMGLECRVLSYLMVRVGDRMVEALVDSGAQMTIMSKSFMESCRLGQYCDRRWRGRAKGVGTAVVLGRIHCLIMEVFSNGQYVSIVTGISVVNSTSGSDCPFLIGLDFFKRFHAVMDFNIDKLKLTFDESHRLYNPHIVSEEHWMDLTIKSSGASMDHSLDGTPLPTPSLDPRALELFAQGKLDKSSGLEHRYLSCSECSEKIESECKEVLEVKRKYKASDPGMTKDVYEKTDTVHHDEKMSLGDFYRHCAKCGVSMGRAIYMYVELGGDVYSAGLKGVGAFDSENDSGREVSEDVSEEVSDDRVGQLQQITNIDTESAKKLLDECNGSVEMAVNKLYGE